MDNIQIIETPKGEKMAVIPLAEYNRLKAIAEDDDTDARDVVVAMNRLNAVKSGKEKNIPGSVVKDIVVGGVHPVRAYRNHKKWTAQQLEEKSGVSRAMISHIENGHRKGNVEAYKALAKAFGISVNELLSD